MRYFSFIFIALMFFAMSCGSDSTITPKWNGCITDANCEDGLKCVAGNCLETNTCESDANCLNGQFCNDSSLCETFCEANDDCGVGFICDLESKKCEIDPNTHLCESNSECKENEICKDYKCIPDETPKSCETDLNCFNGQHCSNSICVDNCTETSCEEGFQCNLDTKECEKFTCVKDSDCKDGFYCENEECKTKEYECTSNNECFVGYICKENKCESIIQNDCDVATDCTDELTIRCMGAHWECQENKCVQECGTECQVDSDCPELPIPINCVGHWSCQENQCIPVCDDEKCGNNVCDEDLGENHLNCPIDCRDDHCDDGTTPMCDMMPPACREGEILAYKNNCYECVNSVTCKTNEGPYCGDGYCDTGEWDSCPQDCQEPECRTDEDCYYDEGLVCMNGQCVVSEVYCGDGYCDERNGENVETCPRDCTNNACGDGYCDEINGENGMTCPQDCEVNTCETNEDCSAGASCVFGQCSNYCFGDFIPCPIGYVCNEQNQCESTSYICGDGICDINEWDTCPIDCQSDTCGDGYCDERNGENIDNCPIDCENIVTCDPDNLEENDSMDTAKAISSSTLYSNLTITYDDEDWYSFEYDGESTLVLSFNFINTNGDIDIYAFQNGQQVTSSEGYTDSEELVIDPTNFRSGTIYVKTALIQNQNEPYHDCQNYSFSLSGNDPNACLPDSFEPNNMRRDSSSIEAGNYNLTLCEGDIDWFTIRLDTYTQLFVTTEAGNKMELYLLGQNTPISTSEITSDGSEILSYTNNDPNNRSIDVMLKVFKSDINTDSSIFDYSLDVQIYYID